MKMKFNDGSFIHIEESNNIGCALTLTMCGVRDDGNKLTMSSVELDANQLQELHNFIANIVKKVSSLENDV